MKVKVTYVAEMEMSIKTATIGMCDNKCTLVQQYIDAPEVFSSDVMKYGQGLRHVTIEFGGAAQQSAIKL